MSELEMLEPFTRQWMRRVLASPPPALADLSPAEARRLSRERQGPLPPMPDISHQRHSIAGCTVHLLRLVSSMSSPPVVVYFHGGGWMMGDFGTHARLLADLIRLTGAAIAFPEYALIPEVTFPLAVEQCYEVTRWVAETAPALGLDGGRVAVAGDSAGGTLAAVIAMLAAQRGAPRLRLQALIYPVTDCDFDRPSYRDFGAGFNLDRSSMELLWEKYVPSAAARHDPLAAPLRATLPDLRGSAPALVVTAECDALRDEGEAYARKLAEAGVPTAAHRFLGTVHGFLIANELACSPPARSGMLLLASHLNSAFQPLQPVAPV